MKLNNSIENLGSIVSKYLITALMFLSSCCFFSSFGQSLKSTFTIDSSLRMKMTNFGIVLFSTVWIKLSKCNFIPDAIVLIVPKSAFSESSWSFISLSRLLITFDSGFILFVDLLFFFDDFDDELLCFL